MILLSRMYFVDFSSCDCPALLIGSLLPCREWYWCCVRMAYCFKQKNFVYSRNSTKKKKNQTAVLVAL